MKNVTFSLLFLVFGFMLLAQNHQLKPGLKVDKYNFNPFYLADVEASPEGILPNRKISKLSIRNAKDISIIPIGTSANGYGYGWGGGQRSLVNVNNELGLITNVHRMGGTLDPGQSSGDLGYDISFDNGNLWSVMVEVHIADWYLPGVYCGPIDVARYPSHGIFNPPGNNDPAQAYAIHFAPIMDCSNDIPWGGYVYGCMNLGNTSDSTKHILSSDTAAGYFQYIPDGFAVSPASGFWAIDYNYNLFDSIWLEQLIINHGVWNADLEDFVLEQSKIPCPTEFSDFIPPNNRIEFSPDGQTGYIAVLSDNGAVDVSTGRSFYPVIYRTENAGQTWSEPMAVALAGENGIGGVLDYLSDEELEEIFMGIVPPRDEIEFTTAFDFDLSVDAFGNPHIAVVVGLTGADDYSLITDVSPSSGKLYAAAFLLSSMNKGEAGSWVGYELGRTQSFRGYFGEDGVYEDNRIQIARDHAASKMFISWLDTDPVASDQNNQPNIWSRGVDIINHTLTVNDAGQALPDNVTANSAAQDSAYLFAMGNEVLDNGSGLYEPVYVYEDFEAFYSNVQFMCIQGFHYTDADFQIVAIDDFDHSTANDFQVSRLNPNPALLETKLTITTKNPCIARISISNLLGEVVKILPPLYCNSGMNTMNLQLTDLNSGIYFYTLDVGDDTRTGKLIVK